MLLVSYKPLGVLYFDYLLSIYLLKWVTEIEIKFYNKSLN